MIKRLDQKTIDQITSNISIPSLTDIVKELIDNSYNLSLDGKKTLNKQTDLSQKVYDYLLTIFEETDIVRQYSDERYPFNCDFYIKSFDLYIECNFNWTHGGHWYDSLNENDQNTLKKWQDKRTDFYKNAINTWTVRDVNKHQIAIDNNLNYLVFWKLSELESWLSSFTINYDNE